MAIPRHFVKVILGGIIFIALLQPTVAFLTPLTSNGGSSGATVLAQAGEACHTSDDYFLDRFSPIAYDNNHGTIAWAEPWDESGDDNDPDSGHIKIPDKELRVGYNAPVETSIKRVANLSGLTSARLSLEYRVPGRLEPDDRVALEIKPANGVWTELDQYFGDDLGTDNRPVDYAIDDYLSVSTSIRFRVLSGFEEISEYIAFDSVRIDCGAPGEPEPTPTTIPTAGTELAVLKNVKNSAPMPGDVISYTIAVTNHGPDDATGVQLTDEMPAGVTYLAHKADQGDYDQHQWQIGNLAVGQHATLLVVAEVNSGTLGSIIVNTAVDLTSDQVDPNPQNNQSAAAISVGVPNVGGATQLFMPLVFKSRCIGGNSYPFSFLDGDWPELENSDRRVKYLAGELQLLSKNENLTHLVWASGAYEHYAIEVKARWADSAAIGTKYGLTFAIAPDLASFYTFMVYPATQEYEIKYFDGSWNTLHSGHSTSIGQGLATNLLSVERVNSQIDIAVNDVPLASIDAPQISGARQVGVGLGPFSKQSGDHNADVRFDDYSICALPGQTVSVTTAKPGAGPGSGGVLGE